MIAELFHHHRGVTYRLYDLRFVRLAMMQRSFPLLQEGAQHHDALSVLAAPAGQLRATQGDDQAHWSAATNILKANM